MDEIKIEDLTTTDLVSAYSGRARKCACGCSGRHVYMDTVSGTAHRGYQVDADEVDPAAVKRILRKVQRSGEAESFGSGWSFQNETRLYVVYLTKTDARME